MPAGWIRVDDTIRDHPKVKRAAAALGIAPVELAGHLVWLWTWAARLAPSGSLRSFDAGAVEEAAGWESATRGIAPGRFVETLVEHRLLDQSSSGELAIHNWSEKNSTEAVKKRKQRTDSARDTAPPRVPRTIRYDTDETKEIVGAAPSNGAPPATPFLVFPAIGTGAQEWVLTLEHMRQLQAVYPTLDVAAEMRKAQAKIATGAVNRKTAKGYPRFVASWLDRSANSARPPQGAAVKPGSTPGARDTMNETTARLMRERNRGGE